MKENLRLWMLRVKLLSAINKQGGSQGMNFVDKILDQIDSLSAYEVIYSIGKNIYDDPLEEQLLSSYPQFMQDIFYIIYFDDGLSMGGILSVLESEATRIYIPSIIISLYNIGAEHDAEILNQIYNKHKIDIDDESIEILGDKLYLYNDVNIWIMLEKYVELKKQHM